MFKTRDETAAYLKKLRADVEELQMRRRATDEVLRALQHPGLKISLDRASRAAWDEYTRTIAHANEEADGTEAVLAQMND